MNKHHSLNFFRNVDATELPGSASPKTRLAVKLVTVAALSIAPLHSALAAHWYVDGKNGSNSHNGSSSYPFLSVWRAWSAAAPGDTIHLKPTATYGYIYLSKKSGYAGKPITIQGDSSTNRAKVSGKGSNYGIMVDGANYLVLKNLDITAPGAGTYAGWSGIYVKNAHHIQITDNVAYDSGCAGIQTQHSDHVTIERNHVYGNSKIVKNNIFCSGISMHWNKDFDSYTGTKMIIRNNIVHGNTNIKACSTCTNSDGSGIIIDDSRRTQTDYKAYKGAHLIENNVVFNNGGRGLHIYKSDRVAVRSNTFYHNNRDYAEGAWRPGEVSVIGSGGTHIHNNIFFSTGSSGTDNTGAHVSISVQDSHTGGSHNIDHNLNYNSKGLTSLQTYFRNNSVAINYGGNNRWGNPWFKSATVDASVANFLPSSGSSAYNFNSPTWSFPARDLHGIQRTAPVTAGAYQRAY